MRLMSALEKVGIEFVYSGDDVVVKKSFPECEIKTNEIVKLNLRYIPSFKVSKLLKESVNNSILRGF